MRHGFYAKLAGSGIRKNGKTYAPYLLTCIGMVMVSYLLFFLMKSERVAGIRGGWTMQEMLRLGSGTFSIFSVIFLFYTNSFLIRRRKREFGLYNILGMGKWNIARILVWESILMALISFAGGLALGILFSKAAELAMIQVLGGEVSFAYSVEGWAVWRTVRLFLAVFALILANSLRQVQMANPMELLHSTSAGEKPPKGNLLLALAGAAILIAAYYIALTIEKPVEVISGFFAAVLMVIVATYLLFISGSVVLCRILKKRKAYYYRANHFVSVSTMMYRMKRNGAGLASICILSTIVLVMVSAAVSLYAGKESALRQQYPRDIDIETLLLAESHADDLAGIHAAVEKALQKDGLHARDLLQYRYVSAGALLNGEELSISASSEIYAQGGSKEEEKTLLVLPLEDFNRITGLEETLETEEVLINYAGDEAYSFDTLTVKGMGTRKVKRVTSERIPGKENPDEIATTLFLIVPDRKAFQEINELQQQVYRENAPRMREFYGFNLNCSEEEQIELCTQIEENVREWQMEDEAGDQMVIVSSIADERAYFYGMYGGLFVLGILLGSVFILATVLIMYYKQITEGYEDQSRFEVMQKVGMTKREIKKSIHSQMMTVFFLPLGVAGIHLLFAFPPVYKLLTMFSLNDKGFLIKVTAGCFLVFTAFYVAVYLITSRSYYRIVSGKKEETDRE